MSWRVIPYMLVGYSIIEWPSILGVPFIVSLIIAQVSLGVQMFIRVQ